VILRQRSGQARGGDAGWCHYDAGARRLRLTLHVQPGARKSAVAGLHGDALKLRIAAPATENKANAALIDFLGELLGVSKSAIAIRHGAAGRRKVLEITCGPDAVTKLKALE
jgi:uncharacterized protein (TIGR00251 family)